RCEIDGLPERTERFRILPLEIPRRTKVRPRPDHRLIQFEGALQRRGRLGELAVRKIGGAKISENDDVVTRQRTRLLERFDRRGVAGALDVEDAERGDRYPVVGSELSRLRI